MAVERSFEVAMVTDGGGVETTNDLKHSKLERS